MSAVWAFVTTVLATAFLAVLGLFMRFVLRLIIKPRITMRQGTEPTDSSRPERAPGDEKMLSPFGGFSVWITSSETISVDKITFTRLCRHQDKCLLFDYLFRVGAIHSRKWCPNANVDTLKEDPRGLEKPSGQEDEAIRQAMFHTGEFSYGLTNRQVQKGIWTSVDAPFQLLKELDHTVRIRLDYHVDLSFKARGLRFFEGLIERVYRMRDNTQFSDSERLSVDFALDKVKAPSQSAWKHKAQETPDSAAGSARYDWFAQTVEARKIISDLQSRIDAFLVKHPPSEVIQVSTQEMLDSIEKEIPGIRSMGFTQPPNGRYRTLSKNGWEDLLPCLSIALDFCRRFMNCANLAALNTYFVQYFPMLPYLLWDSYCYLVVANQKSVLDVFRNLRGRGGGTVTSSVRVLTTELANVVRLHKTKRQWRRGNARLADQYRRLVKRHT